MWHRSQPSSGFFLMSLVFLFSAVSRPILMLWVLLPSSIFRRSGLLVSSRGAGRDCGSQVRDGLFGKGFGVRGGDWLGSPGTIDACPRSSRRGVTGPRGGFRTASAGSVGRSLGLVFFVTRAGRCRNSANDEVLWLRSVTNRKLTILNGGHVAV